MSSVETASALHEPSRSHQIFSSQSFWLFIALIAICIVFSVLQPGTFSSVQNVRNIAMDTAVLLLITVGMTYVIITGGIDLSVGSVLVFSQITAAMVMGALGEENLGLIVVAGIFTAIVSGLAWGIINGLMITRMGVPPLIATLGTLGAAQGVAMLLTNGVNLTSVPTQIVVGLGNGRFLGQVPYLVIVSGVITLIAGLFLAKARFGRHTHAIGSNPKAARRAGINVDRHLVMIYALSGGLSGAAGFLSLARFGATTIGGHGTDNLNAVAAAVIGGVSLFGGIGTILGGVIGAFIPTILQSGLILSSVQPFWQQIVVAIVLVCAVYVDQLRRKRRPSR